MKNLIKQTLERDFDLPRYTDFVKNLFNEIQIQPQEIKVPDSSKEFIKKITFISDFSDTQKKAIDIYAVELAGGTKVERARSFQRNLISKLLKDNIKDAGLVAFYSKNSPDWRLSFIKLDYKLTDKGVKVEVGTPPKRYSFLVGEAEPSHTAQKQLLPILEDHKNNPLLSDLEEAFSVEKVTKEFYERYRKLFEDLSKDLKKNNAFQNIAEKEGIDIDNFAKKLLGQIVFLYFLQKKGWLGVPQDKAWGQGDKFFLRTLFDRAKSGKQDFYDHYLGPLFYDTLNNPRRDEVDPAYSRYFDCKIPFLNGGLFEPDYDWKNAFVSLGNDIFEEIINTFNLYNFTVKEDEPLEKEVAVDPEMLGKVFENLLPENMRKGQGAYYTPREIVHYMCQESLINHLNTETKIDAERIRKLIVFKDEDLVNGNGSRKKSLGFSDDEAQSLDWALANIKVCDPACGSGAFLVGMLNEIVSARRILEPRSEYKLKKEAIQECIYGVDIDPGAVDIAKLRLWLSLVVDFELRDIEPLPNLDYKIMCGNSLLEELIVGEESIKLFDERLLNLSKSNKQKNGLFGEEAFEGRSGAAKNEYLQNILRVKQKELLELHSKNQLTQEKKQEMKREIAVLNKELNPRLKKIRSEDLHSSLFGDKAESFFNILKELHKQYFTEYDPIKKKEKRKQIEDIEFEFIKSSIKEKVDELESKIKNLNMQDPGDRKKQPELMKKKLEYSAIPEQIRNSKTRPYFLWKLNFFEVFQEKGGFDVVIANPPYITITLGKKQRFFSKDEIKAYKAKYADVFEYKGNTFSLFIFKAIMLLREGRFLSFIIPNTLLLNTTFTKLRSVILNNCKIEYLINIKDRVFENVEIGGNLILLLRRDSALGRHKIATKEINTLAAFISKFKYDFIEQDYYNDIAENKFYLDCKSANLVKKISIDTLPLGKIVKFYQGVITGDNKKFLSKKKVDKRYQEILRGRDIGRYYYHFNDNYVLFDKRQLWSNTNEELYRSKEKLINRQTSDSLLAAYDTRGFLTLDSTHIQILINDNFKLKFILAIFNSRLLDYCYKQIADEEGRVFAQVKTVILKTLPIKNVSLAQQKPFVDIVDAILSVVVSVDYISDPIKQAKVKEYERQTDQMVYALYGLTEEEIKVIENSNKA